MKVCRPVEEDEGGGRGNNDDDDDDDNYDVKDVSTTSSSTDNTIPPPPPPPPAMSATNIDTAIPAHTIRTVTVPSVVDHRYVFMSKDMVTKSHNILANLAKIIHLQKPQTSLVFICGEFTRSVVAKDTKKSAAAAAAPLTSGKKTLNVRQNIKQGRRGTVMRQIMKQHENGTTSSGGDLESLSVRKACSILQSLGVDAHPLHVVLGLEPNAGGGLEVGTIIKEEDTNSPNDKVTLPPVLVTFEGSARGLHFDDVDYVFVVGRPSSAASYLHLAGRVGRAIPAARDDSGGYGKVNVRPGTIVSFCSMGRVRELHKWTSQVGAATDLEEIVL